MAERARHRPPGTPAFCVIALWLALSLACFAAGRALAAPYAAVVMDARTGEILHAVNHTTRLHPASLTKMMTLYVVFEAIRNGEIGLDTPVTVSARAASQPPSRLGLRAGQRIALRYLIRAAALRSGNDAAVALAEAVSGSVEAFARRMNRTAAAIGMTGTQFRNPHGLTEAGHYSTARDMTILGRQLYFDFPEYYGIFSRRNENAGIARVTNTNSRFLDSYPGADGIKTGYTAAAGYNLTAMAERDGVRIVATVFGGRSVQDRHERIVALMDRGFRQAPRRAAIRRPARPDYVAPGRPGGAAAVAVAPGGVRHSRASGRTIRLQTAPARSPVPRPRPAPAAPPPALLAAMQSGIDATLARIAAAPSAVPPEAPAAEPPPPVPALAAPERSPVPPARPQAIVAVAALVPPTLAPPDPDSGAEAAAIAADVEAARAAGFTVLSPEAFAALTEPAAPSAPGDPDVSAPDTAAHPPAAAAAAEQAPLALSEHRAGRAPVPRPEPPPPAALAPLPEVAPVSVVDGQVTIPGLPPIPVASAEAAAPAQAAADAIRPEPALVVTAEGQILWHDEDLLTVIDRIAPQVAGPGELVLTVESQPAAEPPPLLPQIVVAAATSGGQIWAIDLGRYGTRFDAERVLLRVALSESGALSGGVRRVEERGGRFRALILSLTQSQAERACARLSAQGQDCAVLAP